MTRLLSTAALLLCLTSCTQDLVLGEQPDMDASDSSTPDLAAFDAVQMAYAYACPRPNLCALQLLLIDVPGPLACLTSEDFSVLPAQPGTYIATAHEFTTPPGSCPVGTYLIKPSSCRRRDATLLNDFQLQSGVNVPCADRLAWDESGMQRYREAARSGLVTITQSTEECVFTLEIIFATQSNYEGEFRIPLAELPSVSQETYCAQKK